MKKFSMRVCDERDVFKPPPSGVMVPGVKCIPAAFDDN
jgi:hypothetical protein